MADAEKPVINSKKGISLSLDYRIIIVVLLVVIAGMLAMWRPWVKANSDDRTIEVTGETTLKAEPNQFIFSPSYQFKNADKTKASEEAVAKNQEVTKKLKELNVADSKIKSSVDGFSNMPYRERETTEEYIYTAQLTITVEDRNHAQQIQDYLLTTAPTGPVSPNAAFSESRRKELEAKARDEATKDARNKADQSAKNLGFKVGGVKSIEDGAGFDGGIIPYSRGTTLELNAEDAKRQLAIQPGENEVRYSVKVVYFIR